VLDEAVVLVELTGEQAEMLNRVLAMLNVESVSARKSKRKAAPSDLASIP
jgi:hypothetical protein